MGVWFNPATVLTVADAAFDFDAPWLSDEEEPPIGAAVAHEVDPLRSDETPPASHPGSPVRPHDDCPLFVKQLTTDPPACGGLTGYPRERATDYQLTVINDPAEWLGRRGPWPERNMRAESAVTAYRLSAHYAFPDRSGPDNRDRLLRDRVLCMGSETQRSHLQKWEETADFAANGLLRLLYLYSHKQYQPNPTRPMIPEPALIPCKLQEEAKAQLLGFKYFGDEPARRLDTATQKDTRNEAVYWSENHQLLYATAEYLAGQLMPGEWFQPVLHWRPEEPRNNEDCDPLVLKPWETRTKYEWGMRGADRMARAYPRLVKWLDHRLMFGFSEWNSPVYYEFDIAGLLNLVDFCDDRAVADKAAIALDLVLFDLARFAGWGQAGATAGRAYPSHKYTGWGATVVDTLQMLFGNWQTDVTREDVIEGWRIEGFEARRKEHLDGFRNHALECAEDANAPNADQVADAARAAEEVRWDAEAETAFRRTRLPPIGKSWVAADSPGAHSLATSTRYCLPDLFQAFAAPPETGRFERSRVSISFDEGRSNYGIGFGGQPDMLAWWSRAGFGTEETIVGSRDLADAWDVEEKEPFSKIPGLFTFPPIVLTRGAKGMAVESEGSCLTTANLALWREKGVALSSVQKFRFGQVGRQAQIWQATLGPYCTVWSTYPAAESAESDSDGPTWWSGNAAQPRVAQRDDALICIHDSTLISYTNGAYGYRSHAWFPIDMFDEAVEVRPDDDDEDVSIVTDWKMANSFQRRADYRINADQGGKWWFGRREDAYVGLFSAKSSTHLETTGRWARREIRCEDRVNVFVCQVGTRDRFGSFENFMKECCGSEIYVGLGVYQPSRPLVDISCSYKLRGKQLEINLKNRWPKYNGQTFRDEDFPRWEDPWNFVPWQTRDYVLTGPGLGGPSPELLHNCHTGARSGTGL